MQAKLSFYPTAISWRFGFSPFAVCLLLFSISSALAQEMARPEKRWVRLRSMVLADSVSALGQASDHFDALYKMNERLQKHNTPLPKPAPAFETTLEKSEALIDNGDYQTAMTTCSSGLKLVAEQSAGKARRLRAMNLLGVLWLRYGQFTEAASIYEAMIERARTFGDSYSESVGRGNRGNVYHAVGKYSQAVAHYDAALALARTVGDREGEGTWLGNLGYVSMLFNRYQPALAYYEKTLSIARATWDQSDLGRCLGNLGSVYHAMGEYPRAVAYYDSALTIARQTRDRWSEGIWLGNLGNVYYLLGDYPQAIDDYTSALKIAHAIHDQESAGSWLDGLGNVYYSLVQPDLAIACYDSALVIAGVIGDRRAAGIRLGNLGNLYYDLGQYEQAIADLDSALIISRAMGDRETEGNHLGNLGNVYYKLRQFPRALECLHLALMIAREIGDRKGEGTWLGDLSAVQQALGQYPPAIASADSALAIALEIGDAEYIWRSYWSLARSHRHLPAAKRNQVIDFYDRAVKALEQMVGRLSKDVHKLSFLENKQTLYRDYISYLLAQAERPYHEKALEISEASRTRALRDLLQGQRTQASLTVEKRLAAIQRTEELLKRAANLPTRPIESAATTRASVVELLENWAAGVQIPPDTLNSAEGAPAIGMREVRAEAATHTLLEYHVLDDGVVIWVIGPNGEFHASKQLIPQNELIALIDSARQTLGAGQIYARDIRPATPVRNANAASFKPVLQKLERLLIQPVAPYLPSTGSRELIILPHEVLFLLPFASLIDSSGKYLVERFTFSLAPSVGLLKFTRGRIREQQNRGQPKLLLMGNPEMPALEMWPPLAGAEQEVNLIAQEVNQKSGPGFQADGALPLQALSLTKGQASEAEFRRIAGVQNYLHLATHGYVVSDALRCGLILAKTGKTMETDGILTTAEIFGLPLNAELVVLSACQTGLGPISSDGVAGLTRAFLYAGAASLIVSLWQVPDAATQYLMVKFYEELARDGNKARALQAAQLHTMKTYPQPRDWAAFMLVGQPK